MRKLYFCGITIGACINNQFCGITCAASAVTVWLALLYHRILPYYHTSGVAAL